MKIHGNGNGSNLDALFGLKKPSGPADARTKEATPATPEAPGTDKVTLSSEHGEIATLLAAVQTPDPGRAAQVAKLKQAVEQGTYRPDPSKVADQLIRHTLIDAVV